MLGLTTWALIRRHRRNTITTGRTAALARRAPAALPGNIPAIQTRPAARLSGAARPAPALTSQRDHTARHFTAVITSSDDPAAVEALIRRALQGTTPDWP